MSARIDNNSHLRSSKEIRVGNLNNDSTIYDNRGMRKCRIESIQTSTDQPRSKIKKEWNYS